jgi:hypothetical protein
MKGLAVSVTTDGFITNIENLEDKIMSKINPKDFSLLKEFSRLREELSGNPEALELKRSGQGIIS